MKKELKIEFVQIADLKPHPENYRTHPEDQISHIVESLETNGFYRNIVIAKDNTILAGHGTVKAAGIVKMKKIPCVRLNIDPMDLRAKKILIGDNETAHLANIDDRKLTDMLRAIQKETGDLTGTGFNPQSLAAYVFVTRPASEIEDLNAAAEWAGAGMPGYEFVPEPLKLIVSFANEKDKSKFAKLIGYEFTDKTKSIWWPPREREDLSALKFESKKNEKKSRS